MTAQYSGPKRLASGSIIAPTAVRSAPFSSAASAGSASAPPSASPTARPAPCRLCPSSLRMAPSFCAGSSEQVE
eukprot:6796897-Prymnesium_polylepis.2